MNIYIYIYIYIYICIYNYYYYNTYLYYMYIFYIKLSILVTQQSDVLSKLTYILFIQLRFISYTANTNDTKNTLTDIQSLFVDCNLKLMATQLIATYFFSDVTDKQLIGESFSFIGLSLVIGAFFMFYINEVNFRLNNSLHNYRLIVIIRTCLTIYIY